MKKRLLFIALIIVGIFGILYFLGGEDNFVEDSDTVEEITEEGLTTQKDIVSIIDEKAGLLTEKNVLENIVGLWQSLDDSKYTLEMQAGGAMIERYTAPICTNRRNMGFGFL